MKKTIEVAIFLLLFSTLNAQCLIRNVSITERNDLSSYITNAIVLDKNSFKDDYDGHIYTIYTLEELETLKIIHLTVRGGRYGDLIEVVNPSLILDIHDQGVFYLNKAPKLQSKTTVYFPAIGVLSFVKYDLDKEEFYDLHHRYKKEDIDINFKPYHNRKILNNTGKRFTPPTIQSILPKIVTAGTKEVLTITGNNFGNSATGLALIEFRNPDYASGNVKAYQSVSPDHILSWNNKKIEVIVPGRDPYLNKSGAGSGNIRLRNSSGETISSNQEIIVVSNQFVKGVNTSLLINDNDFGGYSLSYNNEFNNNIQATESFERALQSWQCGIHSSYVAIGNTDEGSCPINDGINLVSFEKDCKLSPELLAQTTHWFISCSSETTILLEMDIIFDNDVLWHFDTINPPYNKFDFESLALHELGHAHGLAHVLEEETIMFPNYLPREHKRVIDDNTISCGLGIVDISSEINNCTDVDSFLPYPDCSLPCSLIANAVQSSSCDLNGFVEYIVTVIDTNGSRLGFNIYQDGVLESNDPILYNNGGQTTNRINVLGDENIHILKIQDVSNENCWYEFQIIPENCQCTVDVTLSQISNCNEQGMITYVLEVIDNNGSELGFNIKIDGELIQETPFSYVVSGTTFINIEIPGDELEHTIEVIDLLDHSCVNNTTITTPNCQCELSMFIKDIEDCSINDSIKYTIEIFSSNIGNSDFNIYVDNELIPNNPYPYLSSDTTTVVVWLIGDSNEHLISINDIEKETCGADLVVTTKNCQCDIILDIAQNGGCTDEGLIEYIITINQMSISTDSFDLVWNSTLIDGSSFLYDSSGVTIINYWANGNGLNQSLIFKDRQNTSCIINKNILVPNCNCELSSEVMQIDDCTDEKIVNYRLIVKTTNQDATSFYVYIDNVLLEDSPFHYLSDSTIVDFILLGDGKEYTIKIEDIFTQNCWEEHEVITPTCICELSLIASQISECDDNNETMWSVEISDNNGNIEGFDLILDGEVVDPMGYFYTNPKTFITIKLPGDDMIHQLEVQDRGDSSCHVLSLVQADNCICNLSLEVAIDVDCDEENQLNIIGSLIHSNTTTDSFNIYIDGVIYDNIPIPYDSSGFTNFILILTGDGDLHTIEVSDYQNRDCQSSTTIQLPDCNIETMCQLNYKVIQMEDCKDNNFVFNIKFEGPNNPLEQYDVYINNERFIGSPFNYHTSGINTIMLNSICEQTNVSVRDFHNNDCKIDTIINPKVSSTDFSIYPNLFYFNQINLSIEGIDVDDYDRLLPVFLYNIVGKNVYNDFILGRSKMNLNIESNDLTSGVYYLVIGNKEQYKARMVICK